MSDNVPMLPDKLYEKYLNTRACLKELKYSTTSLVSPKLALVGIQSAGKTTFTEIITGLPLGFISEKTGNRSPVEYFLSHDPDLDGYIISVQKGYSAPSEKVPENQLVDVVSKHMRELERRNEFSAEPLIITIRSKYIVDIVLLDLIGFIPNSGLGADSDRIYEIAAKYLRDESYQPIIILKATENISTIPDKLVIAPAFIDPNVSSDPIRQNWQEESIFVVNYINERLQNIRTAEEANGFFSLEQNPNTFFVALQPDNTFKRSKSARYDEIKSKIATVRGAEQNLFQHWLEGLDKDVPLDPNLESRLGIRNTTEGIFKIWGEQIERFFAKALNEIRLQRPKLIETISNIKKRLDLADGDALRAKCKEMLKEFYRRIKAFQTMESYAYGIQKVCYEADKYGAVYEEDTEGGHFETKNCSFILNYKDAMAKVGDIRVSFTKDCEFKLLGTRAYRRLLSMFNFMLISQDFKAKSDSHIRQLGDTTSGEINPMQAVLQLAREQITEAGEGIDWFLTILKSMAMKYFQVVVNSLVKNGGPFAELQSISKLIEELRTTYERFISGLLQRLKDRWEEDIEMYSTVIKFDAPMKMLLSLLVTPFEETMKDVDAYISKGTNDEEEVGADKAAAASPSPASSLKKRIREMWPGKKKATKKAPTQKQIRARMSPEEAWTDLHGDLQELRVIMSEYGKSVFPAECVAGGHASLGIADAGCLDFNYFRACAYEYYIVTMHTIVLNLETRFESFFITSISEDKKGELSSGISDLVNATKYSDQELAIMAGIDVNKLQQQLAENEENLRVFDQITSILTSNVHAFKNL